ncbi:SAM-dependent methyltransferase [Sorangium cellulosum]|uniref:SAM-dependent methyltransferase n=1 Tax=Sorangium cellulosum TaxID=56 RepID=A0A2L0EIW0_SORCE|nr:class I SAM-dependent rRNA methyltransferase [Sorangium cellulosum]AUX39232.1 SAM-dependent methyltransferase [Sorangium cellulosum]
MRVHLTATAAAAVRRGHPWVYRDGIAGAAGRAASAGGRGARAHRAVAAAAVVAASGEVVELAAEGAPFLGRGLWDADSPIAVRVFQRTQAPALDERALAERLERAFALRDGWFAGRDTTAYRMCNGEGDRVPSLVIDRYDRVAVVRLDGGLLAPWVERLLPHLARALGARGVRSIGLRAPAGGADAEGKKLTHVHGPPLPERVVVRELGVAMEVDLARGQKTGAFLDQRDNRARVRALAAGRRRALNLFSYAGGFSVAAALGGAGRVTSVDSASAAHATAQRTFRENGVDPSAHEFVTADVFDFLEKARARGDRYDLIVSDPPSFAPSERAKPRALGAYRRLHTAVARVLDPGGVLCAASCSSHISMEDFVGTLDDATLERDDLRVRALHGQPEDHPTLPAWWEGRYLKFVVLE